MAIPKRLQSKTATAVLLAAVVLSAVTVLRALDPGPVTQLRERSFDIYQHLQPRPYADFPVRVVDIDEASLAQYGQWPWPRTLLAQFVQRLSDLGAAVIALDMIFPEPDRTSPGRIAGQLGIADAAEAERVKSLMSQLPDHDQIFARAIEQAPVVLGFAAARTDNSRRPPVKSGFAIAGVEPSQVVPHFSGAAVNLEILDKAASGIGAMNLSGRDKSGVVRRIPLLFTDGNKIFPNLSTEALRVAQQQKSIVMRGTGASGEMDTGVPALVDLRIGQFRVPVTSAGELWVHFDRDRPERYVSAKDLLDPAKESEVRSKVDGQIVLVGTSAVGLLDIWPTPLGELVPGTSIHAQAIEQIISQNFLIRPDWASGAEIIATLALGALLTGLLIALGAQYAALAGALVIAAGLALSWFAFSIGGLLLDPVYPSVAAATTYLAVVGMLYVTTDREKKFVRRAFGQYLAPELLHKLEQAPQSLQLGGEAKEITIMFMDVRDFTPISEGLSAVELVDFMNALLSPLNDAIQSELGTIDKYIGDSIMAFWNAPLDIPEHSQRACRAALKMRAALAELNGNDAFGFRARGLEPVKIGIGLHTGEACVGNMGSQRRFNYTAMGDVVNTSARIESSSKAVGMDIVVSEEVARVVPGFAFLEAGAMPLKGKSRPMMLFGLVGDEEKAASPEFAELSRRHAELVAAIAERRVADASNALAHCRALGGTLLSNFFNRFEEQIAELSPAARLAQVV
ncbi:MAG TPA: adenylate/guanylate cyclase domain-containing protein [Xanthobacteraceae bacterium]|nr:adenylate/guanylate cyclase domain-containing protein [Xanthobacteraceae bacterium]